MSDELNILNRLESRIQKLINLHTRAKSKIDELNEANKFLNNQLESERQKLRRIEKEMEAVKITKAIQQNETIGVLKNKVNDIIREIDHNLSVMNHKNHKWKIFRISDFKLRISFRNQKSKIRNQEFVKKSESFWKWENYPLKLQ